jgi:hypothetical protein
MTKGQHGVARYARKLAPVNAIVRRPERNSILSDAGERRKIPP